MNSIQLKEVKKIEPFRIYFDDIDKEIIIKYDMFFVTKIQQKISKKAFSKLKGEDIDQLNDFRESFENKDFSDVDLEFVAKIDDYKDDAVEEVCKEIHNFRQINKFIIEGFDFYVNLNEETQILIITNFIDRVTNEGLGSVI